VTKKFTYECEDGRQLNCQIVISCRDSDGADATFDFEWVGDASDNEVKLTTLSPRDQVDIEKWAQDLADENGPDAYRDWVMARADAAYDRMKDGD
jgi:hypothetical protein